jgi:hypothetical protein
MGIKDSMKDGGWRKLLVPGAASLIGAGAGLALSRGQSLRRTLPSLDDVGIGDLADDLRTKLNSVIGKDDTGKGRRTTTTSSKPLSSSELEARRSRREQRRKQRAGR